MRDAAWWIACANDVLTAYGEAFPSAGGVASEPSHRDAIILAMAVAEHETNCGEAWRGSNNWGAVQLRSLTADELAAFHDGTIHAGDYNAAHDGVLHVDTHPLGNGASEPYPVWFAAFPTRVEGIAHFLRVLWRTSLGAPDEFGATPETVAREMYRGRYFEGAHKDDRGYQTRRALPLSAPEQANVTDYANAVARCCTTIAPMLATWDYGITPNDPDKTIDPATSDDKA
jgi:hypothetical protein